MRIEPRGHPIGLLQALRRQTPPEIRLSGLVEGLGAGGGPGARSTCLSMIGPSMYRCGPIAGRPFGTILRCRTFTP
jgi:hypothetical protein